MIPEAAVEAAARGIVASLPNDADFEMHHAWAMGYARAALEAAAPHLMAEAFEQGQKSGMRHADRLVAAAKIDRPDLPGQISRNPYRPTP